MKECNQCGKCCIKYSNGRLSASEQDIAMWDLLRPDIMDYVKDGLIWFDPNTGKELKRCPFLVAIEPNTNSTSLSKYGCSIYHDRPEDCRLYPSNIEEMHNDECEMLEDADLKNKKQAQRKLQIIMSDSHS
ncbi:YkgJ family cysteine cluster protein [Agaribacterium sp. ZY112]|uniref:YkgJ family cysteine cluster protein n=1 Tax=Agaribacterium sp. ZY112 TaxID=3233574 RepID=UPI0035252C4A